MRDFDVEREQRNAEAQTPAAVAARTFKVKGQTFVVSANVHADLIAEFEELQETDGARKTLEVVDRMIVNMLEGDTAANEQLWSSVRADRTDPLTVDDLLGISRWIIEAVTNRPTGQPDASSRTGDTTETDSTAVSSSPVEPTGAAI